MLPIAGTLGWQTREKAIETEWRIESRAGDSPAALVGRVQTTAPYWIQAEKVACFRNAARHLAVGGYFVLELFVPPLRRLVPGQTTVPFAFDADHTGVDCLDVVAQTGTSHHYVRLHGDQFSHHTTNFRYIWPAECDLMAELAGLEFVARYADWDRSPFTAESAQHISIWRKSH